MDNTTNITKQSEHIFISKLDNEIHFNGPINATSMSNLLSELNKLENNNRN